VGLVELPEELLELVERLEELLVGLVELLEELPSDQEGQVQVAVTRLDVEAMFQELVVAHLVATVSLKSLSPEAWYQQLAL